MAANRSSTMPACPSRLPRSSNISNYDVRSLCINLSSIITRISLLMLNHLSNVEFEIVGTSHLSLCDLSKLNSGRHVFVEEDFVRASCAFLGPAGQSLLLLPSMSFLRPSSANDVCRTETFICLASLLVPEVALGKTRSDSFNGPAPRRAGYSCVFCWKTSRGSARHGDNCCLSLLLGSPTCKRVEK